MRPGAGPRSCSRMPFERPAARTGAGAPPLSEPSGERRIRWTDRIGLSGPGSFGRGGGRGARCRGNAGGGAEARRASGLRGPLVPAAPAAADRLLQHRERPQRPRAQCGQVRDPAQPAQSPRVRAPRARASGRCSRGPSSGRSSSPACRAAARPSCTACWCATRRSRHPSPGGWSTRIPPRRARSGEALNRARVQAQFYLMRLLAPELNTLHEVAAGEPEECTDITAQVFQSLRYDSVYRVPSYQSWLQRHGHRRGVPIPQALPAAPGRPGAGPALDPQIPRPCVCAR